jgi:5-amino-6-(5-phospho-D-ribitylamino)uracil phosphatase
MVAIDLDGTLLTDSKQVGVRTVNAIRALKARDIKVVIASARPPRSVRHIYQTLALNTLQINYNGAVIWDEPNRKTIFHRPMEGALVRYIVQDARAKFKNVLVTCEILDRWYTDKLDNTYTTETGRLFKPDVIAPIDSFCNQPITKLLLLGDKKTIQKLEPHLIKTYSKDVSIVRTDENLIQLMHKTVSKAGAMKLVAAEYSIPLQNILAIGDAPNDLGMLQTAGHAVAMDNADPRLKEIAHWIAPSNNDHGVYAALQRYGLVE